MISKQSGSSAFRYSNPGEISSQPGRSAHAKTKLCACGLDSSFFFCFPLNRELSSPSTGFSFFFDSTPALEERQHTRRRPFVPLSNCLRFITNGASHAAGRLSPRSERNNRAGSGGVARVCTRERRVSSSAGGGNGVEAQNREAVGE